MQSSKMLKVTRVKNKKITDLYFVMSQDFPKLEQINQLRNEGIWSKPPCVITHKSNSHIFEFWHKQEVQCCYKLNFLNIIKLSLGGNRSPGALTHVVAAYRPISYLTCL